MKKKYKKYSIYEVNKQIVENALVKLFEVDSINDLTFYWSKDEGDISVGYANVELRKINIKHSDVCEEILFINYFCWDVERDAQTQVFFDTLCSLMKDIDASLSIIKDVWYISVTDEASLKGFNDAEANSIDSYVTGSPSTGKYVFCLR